MKKKAEELIRELVPELQELKDYTSIEYNPVMLKLPTSLTDSGEDCQYLGETYKNMMYNDLLFGNHLKSKADASMKEVSILNGDGEVKVVTLGDIECGEIIGSEIHLEHVLKAGKRKSIGLSWCIPLYDLSKSFQDQSEEFYEFIVNILK